MDRLYQRYADPFSFINGMILSGRFREFIASFWNARQDDENNDTLWQFYLHKVFEGSFEAFKEGLKNNSDHQHLSEQTIETTIQNSMNILNHFNPNE